MANVCPAKHPQPATRHTKTTAAVVAAPAEDGVTEEGPDSTWKKVGKKGRGCLLTKKQQPQLPKEVGKEKPKDVQLAKQKLAENQP